MKTRIFRPIPTLIAIALVLALVHPAGAQIKDGYVAWKPIAGARGYRVQVRERETEKVVRDKTVQTTYLKVDLPVGKYDIRTTPLNVFGRTTVWSDWRPLRVLVSRTPQLDQKSDRKLAANNRNERTFSFALEGDYFFKNVMEVMVRQGDKLIPVQDVEIDDSGQRMVVRLDLTGAAPGGYDLVLRNPFDKVLVRRDFVEVTNRRDFHDFDIAEYRKYVADLTRECGDTNMPDLLIKQCEKHFIVLNLSDRDRANLYYWLRMTGEPYTDNYFDRMNAYDYYAEICPPVFAPARKFMQDRLEKGVVDQVEKDRLKTALRKMERCGG